MRFTSLCYHSPGVCKCAAARRPCRLTQLWLAGTNTYTKAHRDGVLILSTAADADGESREQQLRRRRKQGDKQEDKPGEQSGLRAVSCLGA
jgi:hypothetical protein